MATTRQDRATFPRTRVVSPPPPLLEEEALSSSPPAEWPATLLPVASIASMIEGGPLATKRGMPESKHMRSSRRTGVEALLAWLEQFEGRSWQAKWVASGIEQDARWQEAILAHREALRGVPGKPGITLAVCWLLAYDVVRPSYGWLHRQHERLRSLPTAMFVVRDSDAVESAMQMLRSRAPNQVISDREQRHASFQLARILAHTGKQLLREISLNDLFEARESARGNRSSLPSGAAYNALAWSGLLPDGAPRSFRDSLRSHKLSPAEMVDGHGVKDARIRGLFIDYLRARSARLDYPSLCGLAVSLVANFWTGLEELKPGIDSLRLDRDLVDRWKVQLRTIRRGTSAGKVRGASSFKETLTAVRAFYYDINHWAQADPARYGSFASPNPIEDDDVKALAKASKRTKARMQQRTRERLPHMPKVLLHVERELNRYQSILEAARGLEVDDRFEVGEEMYEIASGKGPYNSASWRRLGGIPVRRLADDTYFDVVQREAVYFWRWAVFNTLKESGVRIEELEELTHPSITKFVVPATGEVLPILQIAPSKTDEERVLLISPELADVLAAVISRVRNHSETGRIPLIRRWDYAEKEESEPAPFLFQRPINGQHSVINRAWTLNQLRETVEEMNLVSESGDLIKFTNHDLRRIFATEAVLAGLPVHILAELLGHQSLDMTMRYAALYDEEVYLQHRAFIERRRRLRPPDEYRTPTEQEWEEFAGHFEHRQLELGRCGRAYGTDCIHEHACLRCGVFDPDPSQLPRLLEIIANLEDRLMEAHEKGWLGEVESIELNLAGARRQRETMARRANRTVGLGLPTIGPPIPVPARTT